MIRDVPLRSRGKWTRKASQDLVRLFLDLMQPCVYDLMIDSCPTILPWRPYRYTSMLTGFRRTSPASLSTLSMCVVQPSPVVDGVIAATRRVLRSCLHLDMLVLSLDTTCTALPTVGVGSSSSSNSGRHAAAPAVVMLPTSQHAALARQCDHCLYVLPFALRARIMWHDIAARGGTYGGSGVSGTTQDVSAFVQAWCEAEERGAMSVMQRLAEKAVPSSCGRKSGTWMR